jgi:hypothetical protein
VQVLSDAQLNVRLAIEAARQKMSESRFSGKTKGGLQLPYNLFSRKNAKKSKISCVLEMLCISMRLTKKVVAFGSWVFASQKSF